MAPWALLALAMYVAVLAGERTEATLAPVFDLLNLTALQLTGPRLQTYPGGQAEKNCAYLDRVFETKVIKHFDPSWLTKPSLMPNSPPYSDSGLYMFSFQCQSGDSNYYPIYLGITGIGFRQRMMAGHSVLTILADKKLHVPQGCGNIQPKIYWTLVQWDDVVTATYIESVFLSTFNFALNTDQNRHYRDHIYQLNPQKTHNAGQQALRTSLDHFAANIGSFIAKEKLP